MQAGGQEFDPPQLHQFFATSSAANVVHTKIVLCDKKMLIGIIIFILLGSFVLWLAWKHPDWYKEFFGKNIPGGGGA